MKMSRDWPVMAIYHLSRTVDRFRGLLEAGGDDDVGDVDDEVAPGVGRGVGRGEFEHARLCAVGFLMIPDLEIAVRGGWAKQYDGGSWYAVVNRYVPPIRCRAFRSLPVQCCHRAARGSRAYVAAGQ
jgi:hypothetical protein